MSNHEMNTIKELKGKLNKPNNQSKPTDKILKYTFITEQRKTIFNENNTKKQVNKQNHQYGH